MTSRALPLLRAAAALALAALAAGCAVTQPKPPEVDLPVAQAPTDAQLALLERWWLAFDDPALAALVDEARADPGRLDRRSDGPYRSENSVLTS